MSDISKVVNVAAEWCFLGLVCSAQVVSVRFKDSAQMSKRRKVSAVKGNSDSDGAAGPSISYVKPKGICGSVEYH